MKEIIVGLAGHIDHGKTSLIKSLTNEFSGSLKEDLKRGMTVDLGIAFLNQKITLIDVPGHENFIKNMISGSHGIDIGLLVIAADDGPMPQTIEHLNIFKLLNISNLIIVINKIDLVDDEIIEVVKLEILELIDNSKFKNSEIINISTLNNEGIDKLKVLLENIGNIQSTKDDGGPFRLPVDRVFSIKGFGTVVTGTVLSGSIQVGDELSVQPINQTFKVRGLNTHNSSSNKISVGQRAAINIQNIDKSKIKRGFQVSSKDFFYGISSIIANIQVLDSAVKPVKKNQRIRIHLGTSEVIGKIILFNQKQIDPGKTSVVLIYFENPIVASYKDKFIIRYYSPLSTIGGGTVILTAINKNNFINDKPMKLKEISALIDKLKSTKNDKYIELIIESFYNNPILIDSFCYQIGYSKSQLLETLKSYNDIIIINHLNKSWLLTIKQFNELKKATLDFMNHFFETSPYSISINKELVNSQLDIKTDFIDYLLIDLENNKKIEKKDDGWVIFKRQISLNENEEKLKDMIIDILENEKFNTSSIEELSSKCNILDKKLIISIIKICEAQKLLIRINETIFITQSNMLILKQKLDYFFKNNSILTVSSFKDLVVTSRKYAIPMLEYLDKIKFTYREGNNRKLLK